MNQTIEKYLLAIGLFLHCLFAEAYDYAITYLGDKGTLVDNYVHCIYKDSDGFIWVGTGSTVERFDGIKSLAYTFDVYLKDAVYAPALVNAILETHRHEYWVGNIRGLWRLNHQTGKIDRMFPEQINFPVQALGKDSKNNLYIGTTNGLYIYDGKKLNRILLNSKSSLPTENEVVGIEMSGDNHVWLLMPGGIALYDSRSDAVKIYSNTLPDCGHLTDVVEVKDTLYIGTEKKGIVAFDLKHNHFFPYWNGMEDGTSVPINDLSYEDDLLGVATSGDGIYLLSLSSGTLLYKATYDSETKNGLLSNKISSILLSKGIIWCGTGYYLGMNCLYNVKTPFQLYRSGAFSSKDLAVRSCLHAGDYTFIGTREGFYFISGKNRQVHHLKSGKKGMEGLRSNLIFSFYPYDGNVLVGTCGGGISVFNPRTDTFIASPLTEVLRSNDIFMFREDKEGNLWIASSDGLYCYDCRTAEIKEYNAANSGMPGNIVYGICMDSEGRFWVGTDKGVTLFNPKTGKCSRDKLPAGFISGEAVRNIYEGRDGTLFFFLLNNTIYVADGDLKNIREPLPHGGFNLVQDDDGHYWIGSSMGIIRTDEHLKSSTLYTVNHLVNAEMGASAGSAIEKDKDGLLWMPCMKGLVEIDTHARFRSNPLQITEVLVNGEHYVDNYTLKSDSILSLANGDNSLTFCFASLGYENPDLIKYEYMLVGRDSVWLNLSGENKISYYHLPSGEYKFRIRKIIDEASTCEVSFVIRSSGAWMWYLIGILAVSGIIVLFVFRKRKVAFMSVSTATVSEQEPPEIPVDDVLLQPDNYVKLSDGEVEELITSLKAYMEKERPYLNVDLKQSEVAAAIGCSAYLLSAVFTHYLKVGYYDFVNGYRVEEFKQAIRNGEYKKYTLVTLAERCGFKSKTSFFRTFKKFTGFTPNEYIQHQEKE